MPKNRRPNFLENNNRIEIRNDYNPRKKLSSPRKYYIKVWAEIK